MTEAMVIKVWSTTSCLPAAVHTLPSWDPISLQVAPAAVISSTRRRKAGASTPSATKTAIFLVFMLAPVRVAILNAASSLTFKAIR